MEDQIQKEVNDEPSVKAVADQGPATPDMKMLAVAGVIILLLLSNLLLAFEIIEPFDDDDDTDPDGGNGGVQPREQVIGELTVYQSYQLIQNNTNNSGFVIMDVRSSSAFSQEHIHGAINLDYFNASFDHYIRLLDRNFTYLVYCDGGGISALALEEMEPLGYMEAYNILNGIERWKELGYEVEGGDS